MEPLEQPDSARNTDTRFMTVFDEHTVVIGATADDETAVVVVGQDPDLTTLTATITGSVRTTSVVDDVFDIVASGSVYCIVVVHGPNDDRLADIEAVSEAYPSIPVIGYVRSDDPRAGSAVVDAGADAYLPAPSFDDPTAELVERIRARRPDPNLSDEILIDPFSAVDAPAIVHGAEGSTIRAVNDAFCERFGYDRTAILGTDVSGITASDRVDTEPDEHVRAAHETGSHTFEWATKRADGTVIPVEVTLVPIGDDREYVLATIRDISGQKHRERELTAERALTRAVFDALPDSFYAFETDGTFLRWNDEFSAVTGYDDDEIGSMHPVDFFPESARPRIAEAIADVFKNDTTVTVEAPFLTRDGERIPHEFTGGKMVDSDGETLGLVGIGRNIAEQKERQRRFEAVSNNTYQFTGLTEPDGTLIEANETALEFTGVDREAVVGRKLWETEWFQAGEESRAAAREAVERAAAGEFYRVELTVQGESGTELIDFSVRPITDEQGEVTLLIPEGRTITEIKRREKHLGVLHRFLRHNLRNKLTVIEGNSEILASELSGTDHELSASLIHGAATDLIDLAETAHELSRTVERADAERRPIDLQKVIAHVAEELGDEFPDASIVVGIETDADVVADWRIETVIEQLVENAIEHAGHADPTVEISVTEADGGVAVGVCDDGPGIPAEELVGITTDDEPTPVEHGTGFGLWLVRSVLNEYGARLDYDRRSDGGSRLSFTLPRAPQEPVSAGQSVESSES